MLKAEVALVGAGSVARSLGAALVASGANVASVISRKAVDAEQLASTLSAMHAGDKLVDLPSSAEAVFVCVPDDVIESVGQELAAGGQSWAGRFVAHTSGSRAASALGALHAQGALVASFHPLMTFPRTGPVRSFDGCHLGLEGEDVAVAVAERIAVLLRARPFRIATDLKPRYHLAASVASNFLATLMGMVEEINGYGDVPGLPRMQVFLPLVRETLENVQAMSPEEALTGPVARGDAGTIREHLGLLSVANPGLLPAYAALVTETVRLAIRGKQISAESGEAILREVALSVEPE